tara:strand:+ start:338 stop:454 length:117 start_codon:yes stop_codon:yes gene_type:complete
MYKITCKCCGYVATVWHLEWSAILCQECKAEIPNPNTK